MSEPDGNKDRTSPAGWEEADDLGEALTFPRYDDVPIASLHFDAENPRFSRTLDGSSESEVLRFMLEDAGLVDLMRSIAAQGFFPGEPLLVSPAPQLGEWIVVEGNRRLAASKLLADPDLAPTRKKTVATVAQSATPSDALPCIQFKTREAILVHLGYRHVTGIKEWDPLAKARFLQQRFDDFSGMPQERFKELARTIGSRSDYVGRLLASLGIYEFAAEREFFGIEGVTEEAVDFSLISSVLAYATIVEYLGLSSSQDVDLASVDAEHVENLFRWVFERTSGKRKTVLGESRNIKILADVVASERALAALEGGLTLQAASEFIGGAKEFRVYMETARQNLVLAREQVPDDHDERSEEAAESVLKLAVGVRDAMAQLRESV